MLRSWDTKELRQKRKNIGERHEKREKERDIKISERGKQQKKKSTKWGNRPSNWISDIRKLKENQRDCKVSEVKSQSDIPY